MPEYAAAAAVKLFVSAGGYASSIAGTLIYGTVYVGTVAAIAYGSSALAAELADNRNPGQLLEQQVAADASRQIIVGERITGGSLVGRYVTGAGNNNLIEVIALADHRCEGVLEYIVNGITQATNLVHGVRTSIPAYRSEPDRLWVTWYDGRHDQTADAVLAGYTLTNQPDWTSNHRGRGVSYAIVEMQWDDDVMLSPVQSQFLMRGGRWYDRRLDDTAGGDGDHRHMDPDTWEYTTNPDVFADHYQLGIVPYPDAVNSAGTPLYSWGLGLRTWQLPFDRFKEEADISDETVLKKDGVTSQERYALNAIFDARSTHRDILTSIAKAKAGRLVDRGGRLAIVGPQVGTPVMTLYDEDLIVGHQHRYSDKKSISDLSNVFRGTFPDPASRFQPIEYPKVGESSWITDDGGDELPADVNIDVDTDEERVQRVVWLHAHDQRRQAKLTEAYGPWAMELEEGDVFERVGRKWPDGKLFMAGRVEFTVSKESGLYVVIDSKEVDPDDVAWDADEAANLSRPPPPTQEAEFAPITAPTLTVSPVSILGGGATIPAIAIALTNATDPRIREALIELVPDGGGPVIQQVIGAGIGEFNGVTIVVSPGVDYIVIVRYQGLVKPSEWSSDHAVTSDPDFIVTEAVFSSTIADGAVTIASFAAGIAPVEIVSSLPVTGNYVGRTVALTTDGKLYRYYAGAFTAQTAAADVAGTLTNSQIADLAATKITGTLTNSQIADLAATKITGQLVTAQIADAAISAAKFASGIAPVEILTSLPVTGNYVGRTVALTTDGKLYRYYSGAFTAQVPAADVSGTLTNAQIADLAATKITGTLTNAQIADLAATKITGTLTNAQIADLAAAKLTGQITTTQITDNAITTPKINAGAVTASQIAAEAIIASKLFLGDASNMLPDDFNDSSWWAQSVGTWVFTTSDTTQLNAMGAVRAIKTTATGANPQGTLTIQNSSHRLPIEPGRSYRFFVRTLVSSGFNGQCRIRVTFYTNTGATTGGTQNIQGTVYTTTPAASETVQDLDGILTAPADAATVLIQFFNPWPAAAASAGSCYYAIPRIFRANAGELTVDGSITAGKIAAGAITTAKLAAAAVTANEIATDAITAAKILAGAITTAKIAAGAVTATEIGALAVTTAKLAASAVTANEIAANAVTTAKINAGAVTATQIAAQAITASKLFVGDASNLLTDNFQDSAAWGAAGTVYTFIAGGATYASALAAMASQYAVKTADGDGTMSQAAQSLSPVNGNFYPAVQPGDTYRFSIRTFAKAGYAGQMRFRYAWYGPDASTGNLVQIGSTLSVLGTSYLTTAAAADTVQDLSVEAVAPAGASRALLQAFNAWPTAINSAQYGLFAYPRIYRMNAGQLTVDGTITTNKLAAGAVTTAKLAAGAITANEIATDAITSAKILAGQITTAKIAAGAITATEIAALAVTTAKIAANAVTANEIAANAVTTAKINAGAVTASQIAALAITASKLAITDFENMLPDPLMTDALVWNVGAGGSFSTSSEITGNLNAPSGVVFNGSGQTSALNGQANIQTAHYARAEGGKVYRFSIRTRTMTGFTGLLQVHAIWYTQAKVLISSQVVLSGTDFRSVAAASNVTSLLEGQTSAAPSNAAYVQFIVYSLWSAGTNAGNAYVADPKLNRAASGELIVDGAITAGKLAAGSVVAGKIAAGSIAAADIGAGQVTAGKIAANAVTATEIDVASLDAISATIGLLRTASTGARTEIEDNQIRVYDASNVMRVRLGVW